MDVRIQTMIQVDPGVQQHWIPIAFTFLLLGIGYTAIMCATCAFSPGLLREKERG